MLNIYFGDMKDVIFNTSIYFKNVYQDEWITDSLSVEMIEDIDDSKVIAGGVIDSPVLGKIPPTRLSGGVKTLINLPYSVKEIYGICSKGKYGGLRQIYNEIFHIYNSSNFMGTIFYLPID